MTASWPACSSQPPAPAAFWAPFVETRHILPAELSAATSAQVRTAVVEALAAMSLVAGPSHTEVKLGPQGVSIVEINPRLAGGMIPELFRLSSGVDLLRSQLCFAGGRPVELPTTCAWFSGIQFLLADRHGVLTEVAGVTQALAVPGVRTVTVTAQVGQQVRPPTDAYDRLGFVIAQASSRAELIAILKQACGLVRLKVGQPAGVAR
jgi:S-sulfo-L-cysteine synthase (3-phospho-L-serine-dependent)